MQRLLNFVQKASAAQEVHISFVGRRITPIGKTASITRNGYMQNVYLSLSKDFVISVRSICLNDGRRDLNQVFEKAVISSF